MANLKISDFTAASALDGTELLGGVQTAANAKITADQLKTYCNTQVEFGFPLPYPAINPAFYNSLGTGLANASTLNAAGIKFAFIGNLYIPGVAVGGTKTLSAAGSGKIAFRTGATTFANGGTNIDIGIQGISTAAGPVVRPDDVFTVKKAAVGGTTTINASAENTLTMSTGSASLANGALLAVVFDCTTRAGADSVIVQGSSTSSLALPNAQAFAAAAWATAVTQISPVIRIEFDDGTLGYLERATSISNGAAETWVTTDNPDERGNTMQVPFACIASGMWMVGGVTDGSSGFTYNVFTDPIGTPTGLTGASGTFDPHQNSGTSGQDRLIVLPFSADVTIPKNTDITPCIRSTGSTNTRLLSWTVSASANKTWFGNGTAGKTTRDNNTGPFAAKSSTVGYWMGLMVKKVIG